MLLNLKKRNLFSCWLWFESWGKGRERMQWRISFTFWHIDKFGNNFLFFLKLTNQEGWWTCQLCSNVEIDWCCAWCLGFKVRISKRPHDTLQSWYCTSWRRWWIGVWSFVLPKRTLHSCHWCCDVGLGIAQDLQIAKKISKFRCSDDEQITYVVWVLSLFPMWPANTLRLRRGYNFHTKLTHQYFRLFDFDACQYHPSVWPCPQAFLPYTEPWWIIDLKFKFFSRPTFWVYIHWWKPSKNLHLFGTKLHKLMQGHQENNGNHWNFL